MEMKDLVTRMVKALVDFPEEVKVTEISSDNTTIIELSVAPGDIGKVIGKKGKTAKAIRNILSASSAKYNKKTMFEIKE